MVVNTLLITDMREGERREGGRGGMREGGDIKERRWSIYSKSFLKKVGATV